MLLAPKHRGLAERRIVALRIDHDLLDLARTPFEQAPHKCRKLVAERLARACRHNCKRMLSADGSLDHLLLHAAKMVKAETVVEKLMHAGHRLPIDCCRTMRKLA